MTINLNNKKIDALAEAFLELRNKGEAKKFLRDLLTAPEIEEFGNRWQTARMLSAKVPYSTIRGFTGLSPRTIARISKWLNKGKGGYKLVINRLSTHHHSSLPVGKGLR